MSRNALIVGINPYQHLTNLELPAKDAEAVAQVLEKYGDFRITRLPETINDDEKLQVGQSPVSVKVLKKALIQLFKPESKQAPDTALFYFAGHGLRETDGVDEGYLCTSDSNPKQSFCGLSMDWLRRLLSESPVKQQIVWLDCCHSGALLNFKQAAPDDGDKARDHCFIAASRDYEVAYDSTRGEHGVLTFALLEGLDPRNKGKVTNFELVNFISEFLRNETQQPMFRNSGSDILLTQTQQIIQPPNVKITKNCPYKGLAYFDSNKTDASNFYGRELLTERLLEVVNESQFLALLGASGNGKSSLARAGLIYQLKQGRRILGSDRWRFLTITPTDNPIQSLAEAFLEDDVVGVERAAQLQISEELLQLGAKGLKQLVISCDVPRVLILIEQFEEMFTLCKQPSLREKFFACILDALALCQGRLCIVITLRADFLRHSSEQDYSGLAQYIEENLIMVASMSEQEIKDAVIKPAKSLGVDVETALMDEILKDVKTVRGALPLLQYALTELWRIRLEDKLTLESYIRIKRLAGALESRADKVYQALSEEQRSAAKWIFLSVTQLGDSSQDTCKRVIKEDLITKKHPEALVDETLKKLTDARLLVSNILAMYEGDISSQTVIDIAHEALIEHWRQLHDWVHHERDFKTWQDGLQQAIDDWLRHKKDKELLLRGTKLIIAKDNQQQYHGLLNRKEMGFINFSLRHSNRRRMLRISSIGTAIALLSGFSSSSYFQYMDIQLQQQHTQRAESQKELALDVIGKFTYDIPTLLANIPETAELSANILEYNIQALEKIYELNPDDKKTRREMAANYLLVGDLWFELLGGIDNALDYYEQGKDLLQLLAREMPTDVDTQRDLSVCYSKLSNLYLKQDERDKVLKYLQKALSIREKIVTLEPDDTLAQRDLSVSLNTSGDIFFGFKQNEKALKYYLYSLEIRQKIVRQDSKNLVAQRDLSASLDRIGKVYLQLNLTDEALRSYQHAANIRLQLSMQDPQNTAAQYDLSMSFERLGNTFSQREQNNKAEKYYQQVLSIRLLISSQNTQSSEAQRGLFISYAKLGLLEKKLKHYKEASDFFQLALKIAEQRANADEQNNLAQNDLLDIKKLIDSVKEK